MRTEIKNPRPLLGFSGKGNREQTLTALGHAARHHRTVGDLARHLQRVAEIRRMQREGAAR